LFSLVLLIPIRRLACVLLAASLLAELLHTELKLASFGTRYITSAPTTQKTSHAAATVETCALIIA
jgi:hypothetical protein